MAQTIPLTPSQQRAVAAMQQARLHVVGRRVWLEVFADADRKDTAATTQDHAPVPTSSRCG